MALERVQRAMLASLHEHGFDDIDIPQLRVLQYPGPDNMRPSELAARLQISKQSLNYKLGELERLGYLERAHDPDDQRSRRILLTPRGHAIVPVIRDAVRQTELEWEAALGSDRVEELRAILIELGTLEPARVPA
ncbi:MAG TPA: MarR family transcriptional regulator [Gaiellaceae bacterium]|jgi:DNA-binding MarR family transcriptional regulator|nr:MarR family transcriptional regulator [Gaiellaceae bacterium]